MVRASQFGFVGLVVIYGISLGFKCNYRRNSMSTGFWDCNWVFKVCWWCMFGRYGWLSRLISIWTVEISFLRMIGWSCCDLMSICLELFLAVSSLLINLLVSHYDCLVVMRFGLCYRLDVPHDDGLYNIFYLTVWGFLRKAHSFSLSGFSLWVCLIRFFKEMVSWDFSYSGYPLFWNCWSKFFFFGLFGFSGLKMLISWYMMLHGSVIWSALLVDFLLWMMVYD